MKTWIFTFLFFSLGFSAFATQNKKTVKLRLQSPTGNLSDVTIYFDEGVTDLYNGNQDARMVFSKVPGVPQFYGVTIDTVACSILGYGSLASTTVVQLGYEVGYAGLYNISAIELDNFDPTSVITLEDRKLGKFYDLRENFDQVELDSNGLGLGRFYVHVSYPVQFASLNSNCDNNAGRITVTADSSLTWNTCQLYNSKNQLLATDSNVNNTINFDSLQAGSYNVVFNYGQYSATKNFELQGNFVVASIGTPGQVIFTNEDVVFSALATNANQYVWTFGDSTIIDGVAHPDQVYLIPGNYTVNLTASNNLGCSATAQTTVMVYQQTTGITNVSAAAFNVYASQKDVTVKMGDVPSANTKMNIYNLLGQSLLQKPLTQQTETFNMGNQPNGYYLVSVESDGEVKTKKILLAD